MALVISPEVETAQAPVGGRAGRPRWGSRTVEYQSAVDRSGVRMCRTWSSLTNVVVNETSQTQRQTLVIPLNLKYLEQANGQTAQQRSP